MATVRFTGDILPDGTIQPPAGIRLPPGKAEITVESVAATGEAPPLRRSLADWAEAEAEHWGDQLKADDVSSFTGRRE